MYWFDMEIPDDCVLLFETAIGWWQRTLSGLTLKGTAQDNVYSIQYSRDAQTKDARLDRNLPNSKNPTRDDISERLRSAADLVSNTLGLGAEGQSVAMEVVARPHHATRPMAIHFYTY